MFRRRRGRRRCVCVCYCNTITNNDYYFHGYIAYGRTGRDRGRPIDLTRVSIHVQPVRWPVVRAVTLPDPIAGPRVSCPTTDVVRGVHNGAVDRSQRIVSCRRTPQPPLQPIDLYARAGRGERNVKTRGICLRYGI